MLIRDGLRFDADKGGAGSGAGGTDTVTPPAFEWATSGLPADDLAFVTEKGWKTVADQTHSYRSLEKLVGVPPERIVKLPTEKDGPDAWNAVYDRLGRPKEAKDYQIPLPAGDPGDFAKAVAPIFHKAGLSQAQVKALAEGVNAHVAADTQRRQTDAAAKHDAEIEVLKKEWGNQYEKNEVIVDTAGKVFGMSVEQITALKRAMGPRDAMRFLYNIGSKISTEGKFVTGDTPQGFDTMTPEQAQAKIQVNTHDKAFIAQYNSADPKVRADAQAEMRRLNQIAFPGESAG